MSVNAMQEFWRRRQPPREWAGGSATKGQLTYGHTWSPSRWCILQSMQCRYVVIFMPWSDLLHDTSFLLFGRLTYFMCGPEWDVDCHWVSNRQCKCKASVLRGLKLVLSDWCLCLAVFRTAVPGVDLAETGLKGHLGCSILPTNQFAALLNCCIMDLRQIGVFQADRIVLWIMPGVQLGLLLFFLAVAVLHFWYNWWLLVPCFVTGILLLNNHPCEECPSLLSLLPGPLHYIIWRDTTHHDVVMLTGLLGGAVYVNAFTLLSREVQPCLQEFSLAAASLADSIGIALADICGVLIQVCSHI